jgi:hypothetical protein
MRSPIVFALVAAALAVVAPSAVASERVDVNATGVRLAVNARGTAMVTYHARGRTFHLLVWGAVNARPPSQTVRQVHFRFDWSGGWKSRHRLVWKNFKNTCAKYDGPPWLPRQTQWELHVSHWTGPLAQLEAYTDWAFNGQAHDLFGRLQYLGNPVYGFGIGRDGAPNDRYGRSLYIDTLDSAYGAGWKRETSISFRRGSGAFCYSFWPTHDNTLPGYPDNPRPAGQGKRYRITVEGPGVTPDLQWEGAGLHDFNPSNGADVDYERRMDALFMQFLGSDKFCPTQR